MLGGVARNDFPNHKGRPGEVGGSLPKSSSNRQDRVKNRPRKTIKLPYLEYKRLETAIFENQFNDKEQKAGAAIRFTSDYKYMVKIENAEDLNYTVIQKWKNK